jgi:hypothetical protein
MENTFAAGDFATGTLFCVNSLKRREQVVVKILFRKEVGAKQQ